MSGETVGRVGQTRCSFDFTLLNFGQSQLDPAQEESREAVAISKMAILNFLMA